MMLIDKFIIKYQFFQNLIEKFVFGHLRKVWLLVLIVFFIGIALLIKPSSYELISFVLGFLGVLFGAFTSWSLFYQEAFNLLKDKTCNEIDFLLTETEIFFEIKEALIPNVENEIEDQKEEYGGYFIDIRDDRVAKRYAPNRDINSFFNDEYFEKSIKLKNICEENFRNSHLDVVKLISLIKKYHYTVAEIAFTGNDTLDLIGPVNEMNLLLKKIKSDIKKTKRAYGKAFILEENV